MRYLFILASLLTVTLACRAQESVESIKDSLDAVVTKLGQEFITNQQAVGLSIGIYYDSTEYFYNFGSTSLEKPALPTKKTVYEIGSITKTFVSYILANAVLQGRVRLNADIRQYLKEDYPNLSYNYYPIQLVHLASTCSLLPDWLPAQPAEMKNLPSDAALELKIKTYERLDKDDLYKALHMIKLDTMPGTRRFHSNAGAQLLAYILEDVFDMSLEELVKKYITSPYKMKQTSFTGTGLAKGYTSSGKKAVYEYVTPYFKGADGLRSSAEDLIKYIELLLDENNPVSALCLKRTADVNSTSGKVLLPMGDGKANAAIYSTALNWFRYHPTPAHTQYWADGGTNGFNSYMVFYPITRCGIVLLANKSDEKIFKALPEIAGRIAKTLSATVVQ